MLPFTTNIINACYNGQFISLNYWVYGKGRRVDGYITSFEQLRIKLRSKFHLTELTLYSIVERKLRLIVSDNHLVAALSRLQKGSNLLLHVYQHQPIQHLPKIKSQPKPYPHITRNKPSHRQPYSNRSQHCTLRIRLKIYQTLCLLPHQTENYKHHITAKY